MNALHRTWQACIALMLAVPILGWIIHVTSGNAVTYLVLISEIGIDPPESYLFSVGYTAIGVLVIPLIFAIFQRNLNDMPVQNDPKLHLMNLLGLSAALAWVIGLLLIANFDTRNESEVHNLGAALVFNSLPVAGVAWAWVDKELSDRTARVHSLTHNAFPILAAAIAALVLFFLSHEFAHWMHPDVVGDGNLGSNRGWFFLFAATEWLLAGLLVAVFWSFKPYFLPPNADAEE